MRTLIAIIALVVVAGCSKEDRPPADPTPPESDEPPELDTSCASDSDCVPAPGCCPAPCTGHVINKKDLDKARAWVETSCPEDRECPDAGGCLSHLYVCESSACQITYHGEPAYKKRQPDE